MIKASGIELDAAHIQGWSDQRLRDELASVLCSTSFDICTATKRAFLTGPRQEHLQHDPELQESCGIHMSSRNACQFLRTRGSVDLCLEDGLSGMFLSRLMFDGAGDDWVILHLDDHADMMPTLLFMGENGLCDPESGAVFCPSRDVDWHTALSRGTVTIGSYLTPLFHAMQGRGQIHIRHLRPSLDPEFGSDVRAVVPVAKTYPAFGAAAFAALAFKDASDGAAGTYKQSIDVTDILADLPPGRLAVHIDLDFFVNDFNGNGGAGPLSLDRVQRGNIRDGMQTIFERVAALGRKVERWIIATSPGFCAARHWNWLLQELCSQISICTGQKEQVAVG